MYNFIVDVPYILRYDPSDLERRFFDTPEWGDSAFLTVTIKKALEKVPSWFKQGQFDDKNVFQNSEETIVQKIIDDPLTTLNLIAKNVTKKIIDKQKNEALRLICSCLYWHKKGHMPLSEWEKTHKRMDGSEILQEDDKSLSLWKNINKAIFCLQSTDVGPEVLRRGYATQNNNDLNKLAILLCVFSGASWSHLITHRLLQKDRDFIRTMLFLSQSFLQENVPDFQINTYLFDLIRKDAVEEFIAYINRYNISSNANIMGIPLIAIACLFGSIQIFNYLRFNNANLTPNLWFFSVASNNPSLIHLLEENKTPIENLENLLILSRSLGYNSIFTYLVDNHSPLETSPQPGQDRLCRNAFLTQVFDSDPENPVDALWREFDFRYLQGISAVDYDEFEKLKKEEKDEQSDYDFNDYVNQIMIITNVPKTVSLDEIRQSYPNVILLRYKDDPYINVVVPSENSYVLKKTPFTLEQVCDLINFDGFSIFVKKLLHDVKRKGLSNYYYYPYISSAE